MYCFIYNLYCYEGGAKIGSRVLKYFDLNPFMLNSWADLCFLFWMQNNTRWMHLNKHVTICRLMAYISIHSAINYNSAFALEQKNKDLFPYHFQFLGVYLFQILCRIFLFTFLYNLNNPHYIKELYIFKNLFNQLSMLKKSHLQSHHHQLPSPSPYICVTPSTQRIKRWLWIRKHLISIRRVRCLSYST